MRKAMVMFNGCSCDEEGLCLPYKPSKLLP